MKEIISADEIEQVSGGTVQFTGMLVADTTPSTTAPAADASAEDAAKAGELSKTPAK